MRGANEQNRYIMNANSLSEEDLVASIVRL